MPNLATDVALQFANQLLMSLPPIAAEETIYSPEISAHATRRYGVLLAAAADAVRLVRQRAAPPGIPQTVTREVNGREQELTIIPAREDPPITQDEIVAMAKIIQGYVHAATAATSASDRLTLESVSTPAAAKPASEEPASEEPAASALPLTTEEPS